MDLVIFGIFTGIAPLIEIVLEKPTAIELSLSNFQSDCLLWFFDSIADSVLKFSPRTLNWCIQIFPFFFSSEDWNVVCSVMFDCLKSW